MTIELAETHVRTRATVLGCPIDRLDLSQAVAVCARAIEEGGFMQHMAVNAAKLVAMHEDQQLRAAVEGCELITADGQSIVWAAKLLGDRLPSRVAGIDLMHSLLTLAASRGYRIYVLGARPEILERAIRRIREEHPTLVIAGYRDGYYRGAEEARVAAAIADARPHMLFVAMTSPRKEYFLARYRSEFNVPLVMGVGGAIDVVAGVRRRAPVLVQRLGLEWMFRLAQEPRRLMKRYLITNLRFTLLLLRGFACHRFGGSS
jgi:N-acetylglucosaminyldiphosphoundecaprenol N-acetyl-beta-D-mannosaminyltransferase